MRSDSRPLHGKDRKPKRNQPDAKDRLHLAEKMENHREKFLPVQLTQIHCHPSSRHPLAFHLEAVRNSPEFRREKGMHDRREKNERRHQIERIGLNPPEQLRPQARHLPVRITLKRHRKNRLLPRSIQAPSQTSPDNQDGKKKSARKKSGHEHRSPCLPQPRPSANQICLPRPPQNNGKKNERSSKNLVFKMEKVRFKKIRKLSQNKYYQKFTKNKKFGRSSKFLVARQMV